MNEVIRAFMTTISIGIVVGGFVHFVGVMGHPDAMSSRRTQKVEKDTVGCFPVGFILGILLAVILFVLNIL